MRKLKLYIKLDKEEFTLEIGLNMEKNPIYQEDEILECIQDMIRFYFSSDPTYLYKYIKNDYVITKDIN